MMPSIATKFHDDNSLLFSLLLSNIGNTLATKKRRAITGERQKASTAHSSIITTLMD
jgi:hypothetical protein